MDVRASPQRPTARDRVSASRAVITVAGATPKSSTAGLWQRGWTLPGDALPSVGRPLRHRRGPDEGISTGIADRYTAPQVGGNSARIASCPTWIVSLVGQGGHGASPSHCRCSRLWASL